MPGLWSPAERLPRCRRVPAVTAIEARKRLDAADANELRIVAMARRHLGCPRLGPVTMLAAAQAHDEARAAWEAYVKALSAETMAAVRECDEKIAAIARST